MDKVKIALNSGNEVFVPLVNLENFRRIFFNQIVEIIYPDAQGNFKEVKKSATSNVDQTKIIESYKSENAALQKEIEDLTAENDMLKATLSTVNTAVDTASEKASKSKTKKSK